MQIAITWWMKYMDLRPVTCHRIFEMREHNVVYIDAAGGDPWTALVARVGSIWVWSRARAPQWLLDQLLERDDNQIAVLEMAAIVLALWTLEEFIAGTAVSMFSDNTVALAALTKGSSRSPEVNCMAAQVWHLASVRSIGLMGYKVASSSNVADGPTREDLSHVRRLGALWLEPKWPCWLTDLWQFAELPESKLSGVHFKA